MKVVGSSPAWELFLGKNSSKNIIIIVCLLLFMLSLKCDVADAVCLGEKKIYKMKITKPGLKQN